VGSMAMAMLGNAEWDGPGSGDDNTSIASGSGNLQKMCLVTVKYSTVTILLPH